MRDCTYLHALVLLRLFLTRRRRRTRLFLLFKPLSCHRLCLGANGGGARALLASQAPVVCEGAC
jgi:hypothetical protein